MRVFIIGGTGYIGSNLSLYLQGKGFDVVRASRGPVSYSTTDREPMVQNVVVDLNRKDSYVEYLMSSDIIVYLAGTALPSDVDSESQHISENLLPFVNLLKANATLSNLPVIFSSSGGTVYGTPISLPISEGHSTLPSSSYGVLKLTMENYLEYFSQSHALRYVSLRIANPYGGIGHTNSNQGLINVSMKRIFSHQPITIWGDGSVIRDYIYMDDLVSAFLAAINYKGKFKKFNIGTGTGYSVIEIVKEIEAATNIKPSVLYEMNHYFGVRSNILDISLAKNELFWSPEFSLSEGIKKAVRCYA